MTLFTPFKILFKSLNIARLVIVNGIFFGVIIVVIALVVGKAREEKAPRAEHTLLLIHPHGSLVEQRTDPGFAGLAAPIRGDESVVRDIVAALNRAKSDDKVKAVLLDLSNLEASGPVSLSVVAAAIENYKTSRKPIFAWADSYREASYFLAGRANRVYIDPMGEVALDGIGGGNLYFKEAMDNYGVKAYVFRTGPYKSAVEPYLFNGMSSAERQVERAYLNDVWDGYLTATAAARGMEREELKAFVDLRPEKTFAYNGDGAALAKAEEMVDVIGVREDAANSAMSQSYTNKKKTFSDAVAAGDSDCAIVDYNVYINDARSSDEKGSVSDKKVAVVYAMGEIVAGSAGSGGIGSDTISDLIDSAASDDDIGAIVMRLNSPGGDAYAGERIYRAIQKARLKKPFVVSMGDVAASGGYWLSLAAQEIWAEPDTLTGSIGVFSYFLNVAPLAEQIGVHVDGEATTPRALGLMSVRALDEGTLSLIEGSVNFIYNTFLERVITAKRAPTLAAADALAQGLIYSGAAAKKIGLVDKIGGLDAAVARAAELAKMQSYTVQDFDTPRSPVARLMEYLPRGVRVGIASFRTSLSLGAFQDMQPRSVLANAIKSSGKVQALEPARFLLR